MVLGDWPAFAHLPCTLYVLWDTDEVVDEVIDVVANGGVVCDDALCLLGRTTSFMDALDECDQSL